ncbi:MAG: hypothetical protein HYS25_14460 [Ignavibacteriales bacterium]|nr:hypothetical protein [Ignavibacteriales bacterium]
MNRKIFFTVFYFLLILSAGQAQQIKYCEMIGKTVNDVIKVYGKPAHQDFNSASMKCLFYQTKGGRSAFIADEKGVYQIQVDLLFGSEREAEKSINNFLNGCSQQAYKIDTLNTGNYKILSPGVKMELTLFENTFTKKFEIKFIANRSENK